MGLTTDLIGLGMAPEKANVLGKEGGSVGSIVAAGSTLATATVLSYGANKLTTASALSVRLPDVPIGSVIHVYNRSGQSQNVFPHTALGTIEGGTAGAAQAVASAANAKFIRWSNTDWLYIAIS